MPGWFVLDEVGGAVYMPITSLPNYTRKPNDQDNSWRGGRRTRIRGHGSRCVRRSAGTATGGRGRGEHNRPITGAHLVKWLFKRKRENIEVWAEGEGGGETGGGVAL